jgi:hypothetical protein
LLKFARGVREVASVESIESLPNQNWELLVLRESGCAEYQQNRAQRRDHARQEK